MSHASKGPFGWITEYSLPLISGVFAALVFANVDSHAFHAFVDYHIGGWMLMGHPVTPHFLVNDVFMVFFFGVAMKEITDALLPGGALNPMTKAINPLLGTLGGILGPAGLYLALSYTLISDPAEQAAVANGWGVPTATDIALAWLVARLIFGPRHPAVSFLLLLAIADDAIGLGIIAVFYPDPNFPVHPISLLWTVGGMLAAFALRRADVRAWIPYVILGGGLSWYGLISAHLHPALALVFIVPFMPPARPDEGLIREGEVEPTTAELARLRTSTLDNFEHAVKGFVDWGLFFFALTNAGVEFSSIGTATWIVLSALLVGKTAGIFLFSAVGVKIGFPLPEGMCLRTLVLAGLVAGLGLTVALFVCGVAFTDPVIQGQAKMGALLSGSVFVLAFVAAKLLGVKPQKDEPPKGATGV